jgi:hypothetical protein
MVLKYSESGHRYREPPYSKDELRDLEARIYQTPVSITQLVGRAAQTPAAGSPKPGAPSPDAAPGSGERLRPDSNER